MTKILKILSLNYAKKKICIPIYKIQNRFGNLKLEQSYNLREDVKHFSSNFYWRKFSLDTEELQWENTNYQKSKSCGCFKSAESYRENWILIWSKILGRNQLLAIFVSSWWFRQFTAFQFSLLRFAETRFCFQT